MQEPKQEVKVQNTKLKHEFWVISSFDAVFAETWTFSTKKDLGQHQVVAAVRSKAPNETRNEFWTFSGIPGRTGKI